MTGAADGVRHARLGPRAWVARQTAWDTNGVLVAGAERALATGPGFSPVDVAGLAGASAVDLLLTHTDFDHLRSVGEHPRATVHASRTTATSLGDEATIGRYQAMAADWGAPWAVRPRVDRVFDPGTALICGGLRVETLAAPGHTRDSVAYLVVRDGLLLPGDYLSTTTFPLVSTPLADAIATQRALLELVRRDTVWLVVPGHGPVLDVLAAAAVGAEDLIYMERLRDAVGDAVREGRTEPETVMRVYARVNPPRVARGGFETLDMHGMNIRRAHGYAREGE